MGKIITTRLNNFDAGVTNERRSTDLRHSQVTKHFDIKTRQHALVPYRSYEDGDSSSATQKITNFLTYSSTIYGLGVVSGTARVEIYSRTDLSGATWGTPANNSSSSRTKNDHVFVPYRKTGKIYGLHGGDQVWSFRIDGGGFSETAQALSYTNAAQGLVHSQDDILYIGYDNKIATNNNDSWTAAALTLPQDRIITSLCEYGPYLAIATRSAQTGGKSRVYLWDRDSTLTTVSENIDWGAGELYVLEEIEGSLVGITSLAGDSGNLFKKTIFKSWTGGSSAKIFQELECDLGGTLGLGLAKQKVNNTLFFIHSITQQGVQNAGVWAIGRNSSGGLAVWLDRLTDNSSTTTPDGFHFYGDYAFIAYNSSGYLMAKTDDQSSFTATSVHETLIIATEGADKTKKLRGVTVMFEQLPANGQVVLKFRKDGATSWTTIFTEATDSAVKHHAVCIESTGVRLSQHKEVEFRLESTGGAVITGLEFTEEIMIKKPYA